MARDEITSTLQRLRRKPSRRSASKIVLLALLTLGIALVVVDLTSSGSQRVLIATTQILPGDSLDDSNTVKISVDLQGQSRFYMDDLAGQRVARSAISAGEFIPVSKVATQLAVQLTSAALEVKRPMSSEIRAGSKVDVYCTKMLSSGGVGEPELTVAGAWVRKITESSALGQTSQIVQLSFAVDYLPELLSCIAREDDTSLVSSGSDQ